METTCRAVAAGGLARLTPGFPCSSHRSISSPDGSVARRRPGDAAATAELQKARFAVTSKA